MTGQGLILNRRMTFIRTAFFLAASVAFGSTAFAQKRIIDCRKDHVLCNPAQFKTIDEKWNNTELRHCRISNKRTGITIRQVKNFTLAFCEINNISKGSGIFFDPKRPSKNVTLKGNRLSNIAKNGIAAPRNSVQQLTIQGNVLRDVATTGGRGLHHGVYVQASGSVLINNKITNVHDGNGIAIRSAARILNNTISGTGKSGIGYFNDHPAPNPSQLVISGNRIDNYGQKRSGRAGIEILTSSPKFPVIDQVIIENNRVKGKNRVACHDHKKCTIK